MLVNQNQNKAKPQQYFYILLNKPFYKKPKFYLFKFNNIFDGLLGLDNFKLLQAKLDYDNTLCSYLYQVTFS